MSEVLLPRPRVPPAPTEPPQPGCRRDARVLPRVTSGVATVIRRPRSYLPKSPGETAPYSALVHRESLQKVMLFRAGGRI